MFLILLCDNKFVQFLSAVLKSFLHIITKHFVDLLYKTIYVSRL